MLSGQKQLSSICFLINIASEQAKYNLVLTGIEEHHFKQTQWAIPVLV